MMDLRVQGVKEGAAPECGAGVPILLGGDENILGRGDGEAELLAARDALRAHRERPAHA